MEKSPAKGQSSLEYLLIIDLTLGIIVPTTYIFYNYSVESSQEISDAHVMKIGTSVIDAAESMFYSGLGSRTTLELNIPQNAKSVQIVDGKELIFNITSNIGVSEILFFSKVNITTLNSNCVINVCSIPELGSPGIKNVKIESVSKESVSIDVV